MLFPVLHCVTCLNIKFQCFLLFHPRLDLVGLDWTLLLQLIFHVLACTLKQPFWHTVTLKPKSPSTYLLYFFFFFLSLLTFQCTLGLCLQTWSPASPGLLWMETEVWTLACRSSGFCFSHRVLLSVGTDRFMLHSGKQHDPKLCPQVQQSRWPSCAHCALHILHSHLSTGSTARSGSLFSSSFTSVRLASMSSSLLASLAGEPGKITQLKINFHSTVFLWHF